MALVKQHVLTQKRLGKHGWVEKREQQKIYKADYAKELPVLLSLPPHLVQITLLFCSLRMPDCPYFFF